MKKVGKILLSTLFLIAVYFLFILFVAHVFRIFDNEFMLVGQQLDKDVFPALGAQYRKVKQCTRYYYFYLVPLYFLTISIRIFCSEHQKYWIELKNRRIEFLIAALISIFLIGLSTMFPIIVEYIDVAPR